MLNLGVGSAVYLHPDIAVGGAPDGQLPIVYSPRTSPDGDWQSLAVVAPKLVKLPVVSGWSRKLRLQGVRVVGNQFIGDESQIDRFLDALKEWMRAHDTPCVLFEDVDTESALWTALTNASKHRLRVERPTVPQPHWWIRFPETPSDYFKQFTQFHYKSWRRVMKKSGVEVERYCSPDEVSRFLCAAQDVSRNSWQGKVLGVRISDSDDHRRYYQSVARAGALRSYLLRRDGQPVAFAVAVQFNGHFLYEETGYDQRFSKIAPGRSLLLSVIDDLIAHDTPKVFDFGSGDAEYKRNFGTHHTMSGPVLLVGNNLSGAAAVSLSKLCMAISRPIHASLMAGKWGQALKRFSRARSSDISTASH